MDHKPYASEINLFSVPLFSKVLDFNLSYADRIKGKEGLVEVKGKKAVSIAQDFISKITPFIEEIRERDSLECFVQRIEDNKLYQNTRIAYDYGLALILLEKYEEAAHHLNEVANCEWEIRVVPEEAESAGNLVDLLNTNPEHAVKEVNMYMQINKESIGCFLEQ